METKKNVPALNKHRVQFDFSPEALQRIEELKAKTDSPTKAEVIRDALKLYEWFVNRIQPSHTITVEDKDGNQLFRIPAELLFS